MLSQRSNEIEFVKIRNSIIDNTLIFASIFGCITFLFTLSRIINKEFHISYLSDFIVITVIVIITIFRKKINLNTKALVILFALFFIIIFDLLQYGLLSANKVFIVLIPFFTSIVFPLKRALSIFSFALLILIIVAILITSGKNPLLTETPHNVTDAVPWIINILILFIVSTAILIISYKFNKAYDNAIQLLENKNKAIAEQENNYREIFHSSSDAIFIHDFNGRIIDVNKSMLQMYGYEFQEVGKISFIDLCSGISPYDLEHSSKYISETILSGEKVFDWHARKKNGDLFWVEVALKKTKIGGNDRILAMVRDITEKKENSLQLEFYKNHLQELVNQKTMELKKTNEDLIFANKELTEQKEELSTTMSKIQQMQAQLIHNEKMASLGIMTAGVAHEINNPLNYIQSGIYAIETYFAEEQTSKLEGNQSMLTKIIGNMQTGIDRIIKIVNGLNSFSSHSKKVNQSCNIHQIIENCLSILDNQIKNKSQIQRNFCKSKFNLFGNEGNLHQAILNILTNSINAIENNGEITITTLLKESKLYIEIKDNGTGMSEDILKRIFDPFFTTKSVGKGTGLGLSIAYGIIKDHYGELIVNSDLNKGTCATIILPIQFENEQ